MSKVSMRAFYCGNRYETYSTTDSFDRSLGHEGRDGLGGNLTSRHTCLHSMAARNASRPVAGRFLACDANGGQAEHDCEVA